MESGTRAVPSASYAAPAQQHPLAVVRAARGWSYRDLAEEVATHARTLGVAMAARREKAWRWENWGVVPDSDSQRALALALEVPTAHVESRPWPAWLPTGSRLRRDLPWDEDGALAALRALIADIDDDVRAFPIADRGVLFDAADAWARRTTVRDGASDAGVGPAASATVADGAPVAQGGDEADGVGDSIGQWLTTNTDALLRLMKAAVTIDPLCFRRRINADLAIVVELLTDPATADLTLRLHRTAATLAGLAAQTCLDVGLHAAAQRYLLTALRCAVVARDQVTGTEIVAALARHCASVGEVLAAQRFSDPAVTPRSPA